MCLTPKAMLLFLSTISPDIYETSADRIVIRSETQEVVWAVKEDIWCIEEPGVAL